MCAHAVKNAMTCGQKCNDAQTCCVIAASYLQGGEVACKTLSTFILPAFTAYAHLLTVGKCCCEWSSECVEGNSHNCCALAVIA